MISAVTVSLVCAAGGVGAGLRFVLDGLIRARVTSTYPVATMAINLTGSLLLGFLTGISAVHLLPHRWQLVAGTGLLGGYTTFSTASFETVRLLQDRRPAAALLNGLGMLVGGTTAAALGLAAGLAV